MFAVADGDGVGVGVAEVVVGDGEVVGGVGDDRHKRTQKRNPQKVESTKDTEGSKKLDCSRRKPNCCPQNTQKARVHKRHKKLKKARQFAAEA